MSERETILIVTPNDTLASSLHKAFIEYRYRTMLAKTEAAGIEQLQLAVPSLILIDFRHLTFEAFARHPQLKDIPIIAVQEPGIEIGEDQCVAELDRGLDACICNQSYRELVARIRAILRTIQRRASVPQTYQVGRLRMDIARHEVHVGDRPVDLTPREFKILRQFLEMPRVVLSRQELLNRVWGEDYALEEHALDVHIHSLRQKIEPDPSKPMFILTVRGVGYKLHPT